MSYMYFINGQVFFRVQLFKSWIASVIQRINYYPDWINISETNLPYPLDRDLSSG